jgi:hypothetical protein
MNNLQKGIIAYREGKVDEARRFFIAALTENLEDEQTWQWMYQVARNDKERFEALNKILKINPANAKAREELAKLSSAPDIKPASAQQSNVSKKARSSQSNSYVALIVMILVAALCCCVISTWDFGGNDQDLDTMAYILCQLYVEDQLKAPSTADFPASSLANIRELDNKVFEVRSYVDAENSFGAMIRTDFYCRIRFTGTPQDDESQSRFWELQDLIIQDRATFHPPAGLDRRFIYTRQWRCTPGSICATATWGDRCVLRQVGSHPTPQVLGCRRIGRQHSGT